MKSDPGELTGEGAFSQGVGLNTLAGPLGVVPTCLLDGS